MPIPRRETEGVLLRPTQPRIEHDSALVHECGEYGTFSCCGRSDQPRSLRSVRGAHPLTQAVLPGQVVMDNLTAPKGERVRKLIEGQG
jgi:hypothetical protein